MVQRRDVVDLEGWEVLTARQPLADELEDLRLAWTVAAHTKSNAVVLASGGKTVGVGAGDQSRVGSATRALHKRATGRSGRWQPRMPSSRSRTALNCWPEPESSAIVAPGGSKRDAEVLAAAERLGLVVRPSPPPPLQALDQ